MKRCPRGTMENITGNCRPYEVGDKVMLRDDVLQRHSRSVPAHMGYTREQFEWRDILRAKKDKIGRIKWAFSSQTRHVNVEFEDGTLIGINDTELIKL